MKLAFVRAHLQIGGVEIIQLELACMLSRAGFDVDVYIWDAGSAPWMAHKYVNNGVRIITGIPENPNDYDAIITVCPELYVDMLSKFKGKLYAIIGNRKPGYFSEAIRDNFDIVGYICDSHDTARYVNDIDKHMSCYRWFFMKDPTTLDIKSHREHFNIPLDKVVFGTMCNLSEKKRVDRIIAAFAKALELGANAYLAIAGDGPLSGKLRTYASAVLPADAFTFVGAQLPYKTGNFLSTVDCFLTSHAADQGGICMSANESVGAGCYLIIGDVAGIRENIYKPEFGTIIPDDKLEEEMPKEILQFSKHNRVYLDRLRQDIKDEYAARYKNQKGIIKWLQR